MQKIKWFVCGEHVYFSLVHLYIHVPFDTLHVFERSVCTGRKRKLSKCETPAACASTPPRIARRNGVVRECLESFVRVWTDCPEAMSIAIGMKMRTKWQGEREIQQAKRVEESLVRSRKTVKNRYIFIEWLHLLSTLF